ncbi:MAG: DUF5103 domain-containing protein [Bacteroidetes bacterium]|nr:DUF5103 domain-containing protein [Bacteroidota bacterium]
MVNKTLLYFFFILPIAILSQTKTGEDEDYVNDNVLKYDDYNYKSSIKTVQIHESSWEFSLPIIDLNGTEQIDLTFDDLDADKRQYNISFIHCNADWTPSDLMISEYLSGYFDLNIINYYFSTNTLQKYIHYDILFPQQNLKFTKSGNYIVYVYADGDKKDLVLSRRFMVYDPKVAIAANFRQTIGGGEQYNKQHIDFTINGSGYDITNPYRDLKVAITQNNRWDNAVTDIKPTFLGGNTLTYSLDDASTFNGGNEFRYFDARSVRFYSEKVKEIYKDANLKNHIVLYSDVPRAAKPYLFYNDFNGKYLIKNNDFKGSQDVEADYVYVDFFIPYLNPETTGNFYVLGKLTDWRMNKMSKMTYNYKRLGYETQLFLKQGYYNYIYVLSNDANKSGDETLMEGNYWDTENDYAILVYHRKIGTYYDQLLGYKKLNSLKK